MTISNKIQAASVRRADCTRCLRAQTACICHWVTPIQPLAEVLILQHPMEVRHAKGSARLLHLSLKGSRIEIGESFTHERLHGLLYDPFPEAGNEETTHVEGSISASRTNAIRRLPLLLYPENAAQAPLPPQPHETSVISENAARLRLVVLDGTWRKSRKMLHLNPLLQQLPRLALRDLPASQYRIRKAHAGDQLSTLEASCHALGQLEQDWERYAPLLRAFDGFVSEQLRFRQ